MSNYTSPVDFFRSYGLQVDQPIADGKWHAVPTVDKPHRRNGRYMIDGDKAVCQNWATQEKAVVWKGQSAEPMSPLERERRAKQRREREETQEKQWARAHSVAAKILASCAPSHHGYPMMKGFTEAEKVLVTPEGAMFLPMRSLEGNELVGGQVIRWLVDERRWEKKFIPGMRAKGAVFRMGNAHAPETILCEGWATGRSLLDAVKTVRLDMSIIVCFSAGNIMAVAERLKSKRAFVFADHDESGAGQKAAEATGLPWIMANDVGQDANDIHIAKGARSLATLVMKLRKQS